MLYKLNETGEKTSYFIQALARILIVADQKEHFRKVFKRFYIRFMTGTAMDILIRLARAWRQRSPQQTGSF